MTKEGQLRSAAPLFDGEHPLFNYLVDLARDATRPGATAVVGLPDGASCYTALVRTLDDAGRALRQDYVSVWIERDGSTIVNDARWAKWLLEPAVESDVSAEGIGKVGVERLHRMIEGIVEERVRATARPDLHFPISGTLPRRS